MFRRDLKNGAIISFADIETVTLLHRDAKYFFSMQVMFPRASCVMWLAAGIKNTSADAAVIKGLLRSISTEIPLLKTAFIDINCGYYNNLARTVNLIIQNFNQLLLEQDSKILTERE